MDERIKVKNKQKELFGEKMLPDICIDIMATLNGSSEPFSEKSIFEIFSFLDDVVRTWVPNEKKTVDSRKDGIVYELINLTYNSLAVEISRLYIEKEFSFV